MHLFELNYDALSSILPLVEKQGLIYFVRTCRFAYDIAMPYLLSSTHLHRDHNQVLDFCLFMLSDPLRWIPMLRVLRISERACIEIDPSSHTSVACKDPRTPRRYASLQGWIGSLLAEVLKHACNLNSLRLDHIELLLECAPEICGAIIFCPRLRTVYFSGMEQRSRDMMMNMFGLRHIDIQHEGDVTALLRPFQSTLEEVSCIIPHTDHQSLGLDKAYQWPRVHTLHLSNHGKNRIFKQGLAHAFPNLRNLLLPPRVAPYTDVTMRGQNECSDCWPRLDYVQGTLVELYNLAFSCPIRELNVRGVVYAQNQRSSPTTTEMFLDLVRATEPLALACSVSEALLDAAFYEQFSQFVPRLRFLELSLIYGCASFSQQLGCLTRSLGNTPMVYISLRLLYTSRSIAIMESERSMIALLIAHAMASVRFIELQWPNPYTIDIRRESPPSHRAWWQASSDVDGKVRTVEELTGDMGHAIRQEWTRYPIRGAVERTLLTTS